jgi:glycogen debranching enzyme
MTFPIQVGPSTITMNRDDRVLVCQPDATIAGLGDGFFTRDTRFVSGYGLWLNGRRPILLNSSPIRFFSARYEFTNDDLFDATGPIERQALSIRVDRTVSGGVHEDIDIVNYTRRPVRLVVEIELQSDFADIFDVRAGTIARRGTLNTRWYAGRGELRTSYTNRDFRRELVVEVERADSQPQYANGRLLFVAEIAAKGLWHACTSWLPITHAGRGRRPAVLPCSSVDVPVAEAGVNRLPAVGVESTNESVRRAWSQAVRDLESLRLEDPNFERGVVVPAAGVPWYVAVFGRDTLIVSMHAIGGYPEFAEGALRRLAALQATENDPIRDMEPGKILHEFRHGELAATGVLPYTPYYGTHDATSLFLVVVSYLYHWLGDIGAVRRYLPNVDAALGWIDHWGDRDRDGFQEYATRSPYGYANQGWKDAGDAVPHRDGMLATPPIALVELQGYVYDAKLRMADLFDIVDRERDAKRLRREAVELFDRFNERFWWDAEDTYYLGLDGSKRPIETVASNPGHLLQSGIVPPDRAARLARRLLAPDLWSGWGIRTLSADHVAYNPFSYHTGSVWPHDNAIIAGGLRRYGFAEEAAQVAKGLFDAAERLSLHRLPELLSGLPRHEASFPVQYLGANVPQAWAASAILRLIAVMCGIHARSDASGSRIYLDPALPGWLPSIALHDLRAGRGSLSFAMEDGSIRVLDNTTGFEVVEGAPPRVAGRYSPESNGPGA